MNCCGGNVMLSSLIPAVCLKRLLQRKDKARLSSRKLDFSAVKSLISVGRVPSVHAAHLPKSHSLRMAVSGSTSRFWGLMSL